MIIGHQKIVKFFDNAIKNSVLSHAYCLVGVGNIGKKTLANYLASQLLNTTEDKLMSHPDYIFLGREVDEKTEKLHKDITVKQARQLRDRLSNRSWMGGYQVIVIDEAELLNAEAANALLKILEEPPRQSVFFLLTTDEGVMLPTIKSRCQLIYLSLVPSAVIAQGLAQLNGDQETIELSTRLAWGRPGRALDFFQDAEKRNNYLTELTRLSGMVGSPFHAKLAAIEELFGKKDDDVQLKRGRWQEVLEIWQMVWRDALLGQYLASPGDSGELSLNKFSVLPAGKILQIIDKLKKAEILMGENINPRLLIEEAVLEF